GQLGTWDVVNEVIYNADWTALRNTIWLQIIGPEYIDSAFVWANRADPGARLYLNDYGAEGGGTKANTILSLVPALRARGIPVHGVGFQAHLGLSAPAATDIQTNLAQFANAGLDVRVSEMDVAVPDTG